MREYAVVSSPNTNTGFQALPCGLKGVRQVHVLLKLSSLPVISKNSSNLSMSKQHRPELLLIASEMKPLSKNLILIFIFTTGT
jgi:hypothetical protein